MKGIGFLFFITMKKFECIVIALLCAKFCLAQNDTIIPISTVEISRQATSLASELLRIVTTLTKQEIADLPVQSINDLLDYLPGIDVRSRGTNGVQADLSIRGGTFDQVVVLLNGINITDPQTGHQSLDIPIDISIIDRIEVLQGTSMNVFGLSSFSGAINIITGTQKKQGVEVGLVGGSNGYFAPHVAARTSNEKWNVTASASTNQSSGYIENTDFQYSNLYFQTNYSDSTIGTLSFQLGTQIKKFGANSFYSFKYPNQYEKDNVLISSLQWLKTLGKTEISATGFYRMHYDEFQLFRNNIDAPAWYKNHNYHISQLSGGNAKFSRYFLFGKLTLGTELRNEHIVSNVLGDTLKSLKKVPFTNPKDSLFFSFGKNRTNVNYFGEQTFVCGKFTASVGFSANYNTMFKSNFCYGVNFGYRINHLLRVYANANKALRLPTFTDMYYKSANQLANPSLQPEESFTWELGSQIQNQRFSCRFSGYYRIGSNIIDWTRTKDDEIWKSMNIDNVNTLGTEISAQYNIGKFIKSVGASYAFCTLNKKSGELISKYALDYLHNFITININHSIYKHLGINWQYSYQERLGCYVDSNGNTINYKPFSLLDLQAYWNNNHTKLFVDVTNLCNTKYYDYGGIEQPEIEFHTGIQIQL